MSEEMIPLSVRVEDLLTVGQTAFEHNEVTYLICSERTVNIEMLIIRSILDHLGFKIVETYYVENDSDGDRIEDVIVETTLPWRSYEVLKAKSTARVAEEVENDWLDVAALESTE